MKFWKIGIVLIVVAVIATVWMLFPTQRPEAEPATGDIAKVAELAANKVVARGTSQASPEEKEHGHLIERWRGELNPHPNDWLKEATSLAMELPNGEVYLLEIDSYRPIGESKGVYRGKVAGEEFSQVLVSYVNLAVSGMIRLPAEGYAWQFRNAGEGNQFFDKIDLNELGECGVCQPREQVEEE